MKLTIKWFQTRKLLPLSIENSLTVVNIINIFWDILIMPLEIYVKITLSLNCNIVKISQNIYIYYSDEKRNIFFEMFQVIIIHSLLNVFIKKRKILYEIYKYI